MFSNDGTSDSETHERPAGGGVSSLIKYYEGGSMPNKGVKGSTPKPSGTTKKLDDQVTPAAPQMDINYSDAETISAVETAQIIHSMPPDASQVDHDYSNIEDVSAAEAPHLIHSMPQGADQFMSDSSQEEIYCPTLRPFANFNVTDDCETLHKAMKGVGTDEKAIIGVMGHRSADQRVEIARQYITSFGKELAKEFKSETSRNFYKCLKGLCYSPIDFIVHQLREAVKGAGTDEGALIDIICPSTNAQIRALKEAYARVFPTRDLEKDVSKDTSGDFQHVLVSLLQASRDESLTVDEDAIQKDASALFRAGEEKRGTDESESYAHLRAVFDEYERISKRDIIEALESEMSGSLLKAMLAIVRCIRNKQQYFAYKLLKCMKGAGTGDRALIRIIVSHCEIDMEKIKEIFEKENAKTLESWIKGDTSGDYRKLLLTLVSGKSE